MVLDNGATERKKQEDEAKAKAREEKLMLELEGRVNKTRGTKDSKEDKENKVKEAWEMVKSGGTAEGKEVVTDGRGVTDADLVAGQATVSGGERHRVKQVCKCLYSAFSR